MQQARVSQHRALVLGVMFTALGCGGKAADQSQPEAPSYGAPRSTAMAAPTASPPYRAQSSPPVNPSPPPSPPPRPLPREQPPADLVRTAAENVLAANCGQCHGPQLTPAQAQDGINYINDIDKLVETGLIVPLNSGASRIIVVMGDGSMPPIASGLPPVAEADIAIVASYIDNPRFWPGSYTADSADAGSEPPSVDAGADGG